METFLESQPNIVTSTTIFLIKYFSICPRESNQQSRFMTLSLLRGQPKSQLIEAPLYLFNENDFPLPWITNQAVEVTDKDHPGSCQSLPSVA